PVPSSSARIAGTHRCTRGTTLSIRLNLAGIPRARYSKSLVPCGVFYCGAFFTTHIGGILTSALEGLHSGVYSCGHRRHLPIASSNLRRLTVKTATRTDSRYSQMLHRCRIEIAAG